MAIPPEEKQEKKFRFSYKFTGALSCYALLLLPLILLGIFVYAPFFWAFTGSLYEFEVGAPARFVGISNFTEIFFRDPVVWLAFGNMLFLTIFMLCVRLTVPLIVAKLIFSLPGDRSRYIYRIIFLVPIVVPAVAVQLIWSGIVYADRGLINEVLGMVGLESFATGWLSNPRTALMACVMVGFPFAGGIEILIYYAGLSGIPQSVNEAAKLEGCVGLKKFFYIDIPMVMSQIKLMLVLTIIAGVQTYENLFILTRGGPGFKTTVPALWMYYNAFSFQRMGYACAIGVCLFLVVFT
ncbi:MAG: sugar ABC transporter permease, partial [Candidatus Hydrogenedentes bacterium]|nr:sugar ABC transporter permease [Candidatus Hydrogenedentota bacterium]